MAVNRRSKNETTGEYDADFVSCTAWRQTAEFVSRYFSKGKMIALEGTLRTGKYQDKNHPDVTHYTTEVYVDNVEFAGGKSDSKSVGNAALGVPQDLPGEFEELLSDGEVPF